MPSPEHHDALYAQISVMISAEMKRQALSLRRTAELSRVSLDTVRRVLKSDPQKLSTVLAITDGLGLRITIDIAKIDTEK